MSKNKSKKIVSFQVIHFPNPEDPKKHVILGYALTEEGNIYEYLGGSWKLLTPIIEGKAVDPS
jgi:hypothetical protein